MYQCSSCLTFKPRSGFYIRKGRTKPNTECKKCNIKRTTELNKTPERVKYSYAWRGANKTYIKGTNLKKFWPGSTKEQALDNYNKLLLEQNHLCAICRKPETSRSSKYNHIRDLAVDHCPKTGAVRGLLCNSCNTGIGNLKHNVDYMTEAIIYLTRSA